MENTDIELGRFAKKAISYRQALDAAPNSRVLEVAPIVSIIEGFADAQELEKSEIVVVDLMSGNGYLSKYLLDAGFVKVHAIEACAEMYTGADNYLDATLHEVPSLDSINNILNEVYPHVVVSLASFHHLIVRDSDGRIDVDQCVQLQSDILSICMKNIQKDGIVIVADIFDDSLLKMVDTLKDNKYWSKTSFSLDRLTVASELKAAIVKSKSLHGYSDQLTQFLKTTESNPTLAWFRNVVDLKADIGHDDAAIGESLVEKVQGKFEMAVDVYNCPWIFKDREQMTAFAWNKFGFVNNETESFTKNAMTTDAEKILGVEARNDEIYLGWKLCLLTLRNKGAKEKSNSKKMLIILLIGLVLLLAIYSIPKKFFFFQSDTMDKIIFILVGIIAKTIFDLFHEK